jgi:hypothetical protein
MTLKIGSTDLQRLDNGFYFKLVYGGPIDGVPEVSGKRVLIPGRDGFYTPANAFEPRHLLIGIKGLVTGTGANHAATQSSLASRFATLKAACDVANREDVTITADGYTIQAGFLRFEGPTSLADLDGEARLDLLIEFDATDPPEWAAS